jgi:hypothetical protein
MPKQLQRVTAREFPITLSFRHPRATIASPAPVSLFAETASADFELKLKVPCQQRPVTGPFNRAYSKSSSKRSASSPGRAGQLTDLATEY